MLKIAGSFLKIQNEKDKILNLSKTCDLIHFDVMDGKFTEKPTVDISKMEFLKELKKPINVHLMVEDVKSYALNAKKVNPNCITFHYEVGNIAENINYIHSLKTKVGIAINPGTDIDKIYPYLSQIDLVLVMSVVPGKGGQKFIDITNKIDKLKKYRDENQLKYLIEVDGGLNSETIKKVKNADIAVIGSYITDSLDYKKNVLKLKNILKNGFTLAELLGVIVILTILSLVAVTAIDSSIKQSRYESCLVQKKNLIEGAKTLLIDYPKLLPESGYGSLDIAVSILQNGGTIDGIKVKGGYIEDNLINPITEKPYVESPSGVFVNVSMGPGIDYKVTFGNSQEDCHK